MQQELNLRLLTEADYESAALTTQPCMLSFANKTEQRLQIWTVPCPLLTCVYKSRHLQILDLQVP